MVRLFPVFRALALASLCGAASGCSEEPDVAVEDPDVEFGAPAPDKDPILDAAVARLVKKAA